MGTTILLSIISFLVLVGIVLSIILIKRNRESDSGILSNKLERYETKCKNNENHLEARITPKATPKQLCKHLKKAEKNHTAAISDKKNY